MKKRRTKTLRKQLIMTIVLATLITFFVLSCVMVVVVSNSYIKQTREDRQFFVESINEQLKNKFNFLEDVVIAIRNDTSIGSFMKAEDYNKSAVEKQLGNLADLFSDRNRIDAQSLFLERVYLFNERKAGICDNFYPTTMDTNNNLNTKYAQYNEDFVISGNEFDYVVDDECLNILFNLYDDNMKLEGSCIMALSLEGLGSFYDEITKYDRFKWQMQTTEGECILKPEDSMENLAEDKSLNNTENLYFGLQVCSAISNTEIYSSLGTTLIALFAVMLILLALSIAGAIFLAYHITEPLRTVAEKIKLVEKGNYDTKLDTYDSEELNNISITFNDMTDRMDYLIH